ncbi:MAG: hypothetical protein ACI9QC_000537 [Oceanicoccus sp.]|jgi:hypothetical protein
MSNEEKKEKRKVQIQPVEFSLLCDYASVSMDGKLSMNGIFERFMAKELPALHPQLFSITKMLIPKGDHKITFSLMQQDKVLASTSIEKKVEKQLVAHNHFWGIKGLQLETWDPVELQIIIDGKQVFVKRIPVLEVKKKEDKA